MSDLDYAEKNIFSELDYVEVVDVVVVVVASCTSARNRRKHSVRGQGRRTLDPIFV